MLVKTIQFTTKELSIFNEGGLEEVSHEVIFEDFIDYIAKYTLPIEIRVLGITCREINVEKLNAMDEIDDLKEENERLTTKLDDIQNAVVNARDYLDTVDSYLDDIESESDY